MIIIAAMTKDRVIGSENSMPWEVPEEFDQFLRSVTGNVVIMGRTSYELFDRYLGDTIMIVVSSSIKELPSAVVCASIESAAETARSYGKPIFVAGGASIYRQTLPLAEELRLSTIHDEYVDKGAVGDAFFPEFDESAWEVARTEKCPRFELRVYRRKASSA